MILDHVSLALVDAGLPVAPVEEFDGEDTRESYVEIAPARVLLVQPRSNRGPIARRVPGFHHVALQTTDVRAAIARFAWEVLPSTERSLARGGPAWILRRAGGVLVELMPVAALKPPEGPTAFRSVVIEGDWPVPVAGVDSRPGTRGVTHVELAVRVAADYLREPSKNFFRFAGSS
jgi:hypothetical protein